MYSTLRVLYACGRELVPSVTSHVGVVMPTNKTMPKLSSLKILSQNLKQFCRNITLMVAQYPGFLWLTNLEIHAGRLFAFLICKQIVSFGGHESFTVRILGVFPHFLSALPSNNQFIIKLVKMWPGGTPHVVVGTLKISLDRLITVPSEKKKKTFLSNVI